MVINFKKAYIKIGITMCTFTVHEDNIYPPPMLSTIVDFLAHPYSAPTKIPRPTPSITPTNTVKCSFLGD